MINEGLLGIEDSRLAFSLAHSAAFAAFCKTARAVVVLLVAAVAAKHQGRDVVRGTRRGAPQTFQEEEKKVFFFLSSLCLFVLSFRGNSTEADTLIRGTLVSTVN